MRARNHGPYRLSITHGATNTVHCLFDSAIIVGCPPAYRGTDLPGQDLELKLLKHFPGIALFIEKPVATGPVDRTFAVAEKLRAAGNVCSVGYMLRYLKAVQQMKQIIQENNLVRRLLAVLYRG